MNYTTVRYAFVRDDRVIRAGLAGGFSADMTVQGIADAKACIRDPQILNAHAWVWLDTELRIADGGHIGDLPAPDAVSSRPTSAVHPAVYGVARDAIDAALCGGADKVARLLADLNPQELEHVERAATRLAEAATTRRVPR